MLRKSSAMLPSIAARSFRTMALSQASLNAERRVTDAVSPTFAGEAFRLALNETNAMKAIASAVRVFMDFSIGKRCGDASKRSDAERNFFWGSRRVFQRAVCP